MTDAPVPPSVPVRGVAVDGQTRCAHYASPRDVVAMRFACCDAYWPCHRCHAELAGHPAVPVPATDFARPHVLCGVCRAELSVHAYRAAMAASPDGDGGASPASPACPSCGAGFNPGCSAHALLYFAVPEPGRAAAEGSDR